MNTTELVEIYLAAWNEADQDRRRALIAGGWTEDATYVDPMMEGNSHTGIDAMIGAAREHFPGLSFRQTGTVDTHHTCLRFSWELGPENGAPVAKGTDFAVLADDGRLRSVTGFLDIVPVG